MSDGIENISDDEVDNIRDSYYFGNDYMGAKGMEEVKGPGMRPPMGIQSKLTYFDRAKQIGRIGPPKTELDRTSARGDFAILVDSLSSSSKNVNYEEAKALKEEQDTLALDVFANSGFVSIRANTAVFKEAYYYEVTLMTDGLMQVGWCTLATTFTSDDGVGDSSHSYAYDGFRVVKWNEQKESYGEPWVAGDVIGTMINFKTREIHYWRNGRHLGVAFQNIRIGPNFAYAPGISLSKGQRAKFNFGHRPFKLDLNGCVLPINEPECIVNNFQTTGDDILGYLNKYRKALQKGASSNAVLAMGSLMLEYLEPILQDAYFMEKNFLPFLYN